MANACTGTVENVKLLAEDLTAGSDNVYEAEISVSITAADSGAPSSLVISAVTTAIQNARRDGKTCTLKGALCRQPGADSAAKKCYPTGSSVAALAVSGATLTGSLSSSLTASQTLAAWTIATSRNALLIVQYSLA